MRVERILSIERVGTAAWRGIQPPDFPFFDHEFLRALERSGSVGDGSGWSPVYLVCWDRGNLLGALCLYAKTDSYGEYIFDWDWAHAYHQNGLSYYPKLVCAVPFTPATGPRLLLHPGLDQSARAAVVDALFDGAGRLAEDLDVSSTHALFVTEDELHEFERRGFAIRHSLQFHWRNRGYGEFSDYLDAMTGKRRRQISRERRQLDEENLRIERLTGEALGGEHASTMYRLYVRTFDRKWGMPYLTRAFFEEAFRTMSDRILLVLARDRSGHPIAGALSFFKGRALFGRYWGATEQRRNLHFELCYYQAIEFAIEREMKLFEAGAQGEHKLARGFLPSITYSAHDIRHPVFRRAIENYIFEERDYLAETVAEYKRHDPYKR